MPYKVVLAEARPVLIFKFIEWSFCRRSWPVSSCLIGTTWTGFNYWGRIWMDTWTYSGLAARTDHGYGSLMNGFQRSPRWLSSTFWSRAPCPSKW